MLRGIFGNAAFVLCNLAIPFIPIFINIILMQTCPFWVTIFAFFINNERIEWTEILGIVICMCAVVVIVLDHRREVKEENDMLIAEGTE